MSNVPWSVKGVEHEAREAAKLAARKAGLPLGVWLSQTIHATAAQQLKSSSGPATYAQTAYAHSNGADMPAGSSIPRPPALTPEAVLESINRLANKIEETEARTAEALAPIIEKVAKLSAQVEENGGSANARIDVDPLERALMRMTERLDRIEQGPDGASAERGSHVQGRRRPGFFGRLFSD